MSSFWTSLRGFDHDPTAPLREEFDRLAEQRGWKLKSENYKQNWVRCALEEFGYQFGRDEDRLAGWQALCAIVGVTDVPDTIVGCRAIMKKTWVNIYDLLDAQRTGGPVVQHRTKHALRVYSLQNEKIFPKETAKENRFLAVLLIDMFARARP
ncbi:unnamed protein product [Mycena citricolor]|uniref:Uncharacterized protein n=1 Tax=Mycena citricolor TaxID=2018698 RepID=A0AAD2HRH1_9AGAR|nr:unnamed protein product [Mycena citricolor]CAK5279665.1 unnamed protein product [Mycena citricolor]